MAFAILAHIGTGSTNGNGVTSGSIDSSTATCLVAGVVNNNPVVAVSGENVLTDSKSNAWTAGTAIIQSTSARVKPYWCLNPTSVGTGHTAILSAITGSFPVVFFAALSGFPSAIFLEGQAAGGTSGSAIDVQTGSLAPSLGLLTDFFWTIIGWDSAVTAQAIDSSFTIQDNVAQSGNNYRAAWATKIQTTGGAENPSWSWTTASPVATAMAALRTTPRGGLAALGVG